MYRSDRAGRAGVGAGVTRELTDDEVSAWLKKHPDFAVHDPVNEIGVNSADGSFVILCAMYDINGHPNRPIVALYGTPKQREPDGFCGREEFLKSIKPQVQP